MRHYSPDSSDYDLAWSSYSLSFMQHRAWGVVKRATYYPEFVFIEDLPFALYVRFLPVVGGKFAYSPRAFSKSTLPPPEVLSEAAGEICDRFKLSHLIIEPNVELEDKNILTRYRDRGFIFDESTIQPRYTRMIDLTKSEDVLFGEMDKDVRRRTNRALQEGYHFEEKSDKEGLNEFYDGLSEVAKRGKFNINTKSYFERILSSFPSGMAKIFLVRDKQGQLLYATFVINDGEAFRRIYGGPTLKGREGDAAQFTAWQTILAAKRSGAKKLDLWGVAPYNTEGFIQRHPLTGTSKFKASLGGRNITYWPALIYVKSKTRYKAYRFLAGTLNNLKRVRAAV